MAKVKAKINQIIDDVNREDSIIISFFENITDRMFYLIKWGGIPFVTYLLFTVSKW